MKSGISEFSFGYAVTEEIVRQQRHVMVGAPVFPSLYDEGRPGGGYDLLLQRVGFPLMLQFKLTQKMVKKSAMEIKTHRLSAPPFYRIQLMPTKLSEQHNMLLSLDDGFNEVYYAAPLFSTQNELNDYYTANTVLENCIFIKPNTIGPLPDDDDHHVSIDDNPSRGFLFSSQPKQIGPLQTGLSFSSSLLEKVSREEERLSNNIEKLYDRLFEIVAKSNEYRSNKIFSQISDQPSTLSKIYYLANYFFSSEVILICRASARSNAIAQ
jgi:hypothetical protein